MPNENDSNAPTDQSGPHSGSQSEVLPKAEAHGGMGAKPNNNAEDQQSAATEMRREFRWFEFGSLFINGALVIIGALALCIYGGQLKVMRGQLDEMSAARRPWIGPVGELKMTRPPSFDTSMTPEPSPVLEELKKKYPGIDKPVVSINIWATWAFQNYGPSPARRIQHTFLVYATDDPKNPPAETKNMACVIGNQMESHPAEILSTALFPGNAITLPETNSISVMARGTKSIAAVWLVGCITYQDTAGNILHHTRILWVSDFSDAGKPELAIENPPVMWTPFTKFRLVESDID